MYQHLLEVSDGSDTQIEQSTDNERKEAENAPKSAKKATKTKEVVSEPDQNKPEKASAATKATPQQVKLIEEAINKEESPDDVRNAILEMYSVKSIEEMTVSQASDCLVRFE